MNRAQRARARAVAMARRTTLKQKRRAIALKKKNEIKAIRQKYNDPWRSRKARINRLYERYIL
jgi:hypothetical protein